MQYYTMNSLNSPLHETQLQRVEFLHLAEERVEVGTDGEVGDREVTDNTNTQTDTSNGR